MPIQEKIAVAAIVLAAALYLVRLTVAKYQKRASEDRCGGCGCGKAVTKPDRSRRPSVFPG